MCFPGKEQAFKVGKKHSMQMSKMLTATAHSAHSVVQEIRGWWCTWSDEAEESNGGKAVCRLAEETGIGLPGKGFRRCKT